MRKSRRYAIAVAAILASSVCAQAMVFYVNYSARIDPAVVRVYDFSILSPYSDAPIADLKKQGHPSYAYLSVVEIAADAPYRKTALTNGIHLLATNELAGSELVDVSDPAWRRFVVGTLAAFAAGKQFDGFFLDTAESVELLAKKFPARQEQYRNGLVALVQELKRAYPEKKIIINRGFAVWERLRAVLDGVLIESLFQTGDPGGKTYAAVDPAGTQWLLAIAGKIKAGGLAVYVIDYVDPAKPALAEETARRIERAGFYPLITTPELNGRILAPLREVPRSILVVFGNQEPTVERAIRWPIDSSTAHMSQMIVEWLGYEIEYFNPTLQALPNELDSKFAAVILDRALVIPAEKEMETALWLDRQKTLGVKIIFLGEIPFQESEPRARVLRDFGFRGTGRLYTQSRNLQIGARSAQMNYEAPTVLQPHLLSDVQGPAGSEILLSVKGEAPYGERIQFDPIFVAPWGGAALNPYGWFLRPDSDEHWAFDPFNFFNRALSCPLWPAVDSTTRDGLRIFYSHIDGDGFSDRSQVEVGKRSGEVVLERVVKKYPFPITCSIIEAEVRALSIGQTPEEEKLLTKVAREIFALPNVQAGSHSYSHPFFWSENDKTAALYQRPALNLRDPYQFDQINVKREVVGSVEYIQQHLLPPGKKLEIFLWSGNCRPQPEAIRLTRELGIENLNGGDTIISRKHPSAGRVAPRAISWDDELQINSSNQNESIYNERWQTSGEWSRPFYGGFINALDTFARTESPRRINPVNIYFHWYSGDDLASLNSVIRLFDWAASQPLHAVTAASFARMIRDCRQTRLFRAAENHWIILNHGQLRTFRFAQTNWVPDFKASRGVIGYAIHQDSLYVDTDGSPRVDLLLATQPAPHLHLVSSSAEIQFTTWAPDHVAFTVKDWRPCHVVLAGFRPGGAATVTVNGAASTAAADSQGQLHLTLPKEATVIAKRS